MPPTPEQAAAFVRDATFVWHQRFELAPGVSTPGTNDIGWLVQVAGLPDDLSGKTVLDIGTTNGGAAFALERRGPARVVAVDIFPPEWFGVSQLTELLDSKVEYVRTSVYELAERFPEPFDVVLFWGVLYHLRHPLLALDNLRAVTGGQAVLETAVCDGELRRRDRDRSLVRYYRGGELSDDPQQLVLPVHHGAGGVVRLERVRGRAGGSVAAQGAGARDGAARARRGPARVRADLVRAAAALLRQRPHRLAARERRVEQRGGAGGARRALRSGLDEGPDDRGRARACAMPGPASSPAEARARRRLRRRLRVAHAGRGRRERGGRHRQGRARDRGHGADHAGACASTWATSPRSRTRPASSTSWSASR